MYGIRSHHNLFVIPLFLGGRDEFDLFYGEDDGIARILFAKKLVKKIEEHIKMRHEACN